MSYLATTEAEFVRIDEVVPADKLAGTRYAATLVALLDGERGPKSSARTCRMCGLRADEPSR